MSRSTFLGTVLFASVLAAPLFAQETPSPAAAPKMLGTVTLTQSVLAGGKPLAPGTYEIRLTGESLAPLPGQTPGAESWVEFVSNGTTVAAREVATVIQPDDGPVGTAGKPGARSTVRVERLKGDEFLRVSVTHDGARYLIHLPLAR